MRQASNRTHLRLLRAGIFVLLLLWPVARASSQVAGGWIDIVPRQLFPQLVRYARLPISTGVLVSEVTPHGNADLAGMRGGDPNRAVRYGNTIIYLGGDIIVQVNGISVKNLKDLFAALAATEPGQHVPVTVQRGMEQIRLDVTISRRPDGSLGTAGS